MPLLKFFLLLGVFNPLSPGPALGANPLWFPLSSTRVLTLAQSLWKTEPPLRKFSAPTHIQQAVMQDLSKRTGQPTKTFKIMSMEQQSWPDGCLGLSEPNVLCTQMLVPGWQVLISDDSRQWTYRTDDSGVVVKLDPRQ